MATTVPAPFERKRSTMSEALKDSSLISPSWPCVATGTSTGSSQFWPSISKPWPEKWNTTVSPGSILDSAAARARLICRLVPFSTVSTEKPASRRPALMARASLTPAVSAGTST